MKISVVTVCFNAINEIESTMLSVLNQTYHDVEYIVIDGGSTDGTVEVIKKYADRIAYWVSEPDKGIFDAMNKGITHATGEYINFMNAGDKFYSPKVISTFFSNRIEGPDFIAGIGILKKKSRLPLIWEPVRKNFKLEEVICGGACNHQSCFIKRSLLKKEEGYNLNYKIIADELFFLKNVIFGKATYERVLKPVALYDITGISNNSQQFDKTNVIRREFMLNYFSDSELSAIQTRSSHYKRLRRIKRLFVRIYLSIIAK